MLFVKKKKIMINYNNSLIFAVLCPVIFSTFRDLMLQFWLLWDLLLLLLQLVDSVISFFLRFSRLCKIRFSDLLIKTPPPSPMKEREGVAFSRTHTRKYSRPPPFSSFCWLAIKKLNDLAGFIKCQSFPPPPYNRELPH